MGPGTNPFSMFELLNALLSKIVVESLRCVYYGKVLEIFYLPEFEEVEDDDEDDDDGPFDGYNELLPPARLFESIIG